MTAKALSTATLTILEPCRGIFAYYDGRVAGKRLYAEAPNWVDDGAYDLGIASYAIVADDEALVYDTHMSLNHAQVIRAHLEGLGVRRFRVVLSHWHTDHVAGNAVFADCAILAQRLTADALARERPALESGDPPINPLVMPNTVFSGRLDLTVGDRRIELHPFAIHSGDGLVLWLPDEALLLAGDTLEDTITYVAEPAQIPTHVAELLRLRDLAKGKILPNHGDPGRIAAGGYEPTLIDANRLYLERLWTACAAVEGPAGTLADFVAEDAAAGAIGYFAPYEAVHRRNSLAVRAALERSAIG